MNARIDETHAASTLLTYLREVALPDLPEALWDGHLWMYGEIVPLLGAPLTGYETDRIRMYAAGEYGKTIGVAVAVRGGSGVRAYVHGATPEVVTDLVARATEDAGPVAEASTLCESHAAAICSAFKADATVWAQRKLWTGARSARRPDDPNGLVRELGPEDAPLFDAITFADGTRGWPGFRACLASGLRYFGTFPGGRFASVAGLCRLTQARSEIIGVATFREEDRRRGHAAAACRTALGAALAECGVCTWTARADNEASVRTALALGMQDYLGRWDVSVPGRDFGGVKPA